jgi:hypothetical protein
MLLSPGPTGNSTNATSPTEAVASIPAVHPMEAKAHVSSESVLIFIYFIIAKPSLNLKFRHDVSQTHQRTWLVGAE